MRARPLGTVGRAARAIVTSAAVVVPAAVVITAAVVLALLGVVSSRAVAARTRPQADVLASASVTQSGQQLVWKVTLTAPFSATQMKRERRSLCLLIERVQDGGVSGQLCVIGPRPGRTAPRLVYQPVTREGPGPARVVAATLTGPGSRQLTATFTSSAYGAATYASLRWQVRTTLRTRPCTSAKGDPVGCVRLFPARSRLVTLHTPQVVGCVPSGPAYVTNGSRSVHELALTFDDGPWYDTPQFLNILEHYDVPATFFEIGDQVSVYGQGGAIERRMLTDGDMLGDHTWNHANVAAGGSFAAGEITQTAQAITAATGGFHPCLFRAPYGAVSGALISEARSMGFTTIGWDVDPRDWSRPEPPPSTTPSPARPRMARSSSSTTAAATAPRRSRHCRRRSRRSSARATRS